MANVYIFVYMCLAVLYQKNALSVEIKSCYAPWGGGFTSR